MLYLRGFFDGGRAEAVEDCDDDDQSNCIGSGKLGRFAVFGDTAERVRGSDGVLLRSHFESFTISSITVLTLSSIGHLLSAIQCPVTAVSYIMQKEQTRLNMAPHTLLGIRVFLLRVKFSSSAKQNPNSLAIVC